MTTILDAINLTEIAQSRITTLGARPVDPIGQTDLPKHVMQAFEAPLDYPPLSEATVPGDFVAIALHAEVPQVGQILAGTISALSHAGVEESHITVLIPAQLDDLRGELQNIVGPEISIHLHAPNDLDGLALLGVTKGGLPLRLNRILCEADVIIPIGSTCIDSPYRHPRGMIVPTFSDQETLARFQAPRSVENATQRTKLAKEVEESEWLLGLGIAMEVVPGPEGTVAQCYCGTPPTVARAAAERYREIWCQPTSETADLVVAMVRENVKQLDWHALGQALSAVEELVETGGAIVLCSDLTSQPGQALKRLFNAGDLSVVEEKIKRDPFADSYLALQLCRVLQRHTIYLASALDPEIVEGYGLAPLSNEQELQRLIGAYRSCILLKDAQFLRPTLENASPKLYKKEHRDSPRIH